MIFLTQAFVFFPTVVTDEFCKGLIYWGEEEAGRAASLSSKRARKSSCHVNMFPVLFEHGFAKVTPLVE